MAISVTATLDPAAASTRFLKRGPEPERRAQHINNNNSAHVTALSPLTSLSPSRTMGNDILYKWEDSPALKHHCGFCERPLSHPGARSSCFGPHAEPCHRFHQAMFMRNRAHMCAMCHKADQAHHKRHEDMAERLRNIYESCGQDWSIVPSEEPGRGRARTKEFDLLDDNNRSSTSGEVQATKKDKKEQKRLVRAASRRPVLTLEEIQYIESVLHPASSNGDAEGPRNPDEVDEIEKNLRYNAQIYNTGAKRCFIKDFARIADADVDFEGEMDRILNILRVADLLKRNTRNRGLVGKELKHFQDLVTEFKERVVEDLLLLKKEEMEVRMRRASYLRYTNRASFEIVEQRYAAKDWKTGLKFSESPAVQSISSGSVNSYEEECEREDDENDNQSVVDWRREASLSHLPPDSPDTRHLLRGHKRIGSGGKVEEVVSIRRSPTCSPNKPQGIFKRKRPLQMRIVPHAQPKPRELETHSSPKSLVSENAWKRPSRSSPHRRVSFKRPITTNENGWQVVGRAAPKAVMMSKYAASFAPSKESSWPAGLKELSFGGIGDALERLPTAADMSDPAQETFVTPPKDKTTSLSPSATESENQVDKATPGAAVPEITIVSLEPHECTEIGHPAIGQKMRKKKQREAERKARRATERQNKANIEVAVDEISSVTESGMEPERVEDVQARSTSSEYSESGRPVFSLEATARVDEIKKGESSRVSGSAQVNQHKLSIPLSIGKPVPFVSGKAQLVNIPASRIAKSSTVPVKTPQKATEITKRSHYSDWTKYIHHLRVDGSSYSIPTDDYAHSHSCPFTSDSAGRASHQTYCVGCGPRSVQSFVVCPMRDVYTEGPFSAPRARKVLAHFEADPRTKGRLMLVDDDMLTWLMSDSSKLDRCAIALAGDMPPDLYYEVSDYFDGRAKGPLMRQTETYRAKFWRNNEDKDHLFPSELAKLYEAFKKEYARKRKICFCEQDTFDEELVECNFRHCKYHVFHRSCFKELDVEVPKTWYCPDCGEMLARIASMVLVEVECIRKGKPFPGPLAVDMMNCRVKETVEGDEVVFGDVSSEGDEEELIEEMEMDMLAQAEAEARAFLVEDVD